MKTSLPVLIVDDSSTMIQIIADLVRKNGFTDVDTEHDGPSALQRLRQKQYGLVLSDWEMEPMSGKELFEQMSRDKTVGNVPIILITGTAGKGTAWLAGAAAYLGKLACTRFG
ncbi:MAG TPA: response regulator [Xanthobacteraceae bacterium]|nr:response regulator [Xanthobacteraceae bacterium]